MDKIYKANINKEKGIELCLTSEEAKILKAALTAYVLLDDFGNAVWCEWTGSGDADDCWRVLAHDLMMRIPNDIQPNWGWSGEADLREIIKREWQLKKEEAACGGSYVRVSDKSKQGRKLFLKRGLSKRIKRLQKELKNAEDKMKRFV